MFGTDRSRGVAAVALLIAVLAAACGGTDDVETASSEPAGEEPAGDVLPASTFDGEAMTVAGESYDLSQLAGTDVVLWFWAPW